MMPFLLNKNFVHDSQSQYIYKKVFFLEKNISMTTIKTPEILLKLPKSSTFTACNVIHRHYEFNCV